MRPGPLHFGCALALGIGVLMLAAGLKAKSALSRALNPFPTSQTGDHHG